MSTLRLLAVDRSALAKNMYRLLFEELPGYKIEYAENGDDLLGRKRRAKPHVVLINSNAIEKGVLPPFMEHYPTVLLNSPDRLDLKEIKGRLVAIVEKPFYPYDLITIINRVASDNYPIKMPTAAPPRRRRRRSAKKGN